MKPDFVAVIEDTKVNVGFTISQVTLSVPVSAGDVMGREAERYKVA